MALLLLILIGLIYSPRCCCESYFIPASDIVNVSIGGNIAEVVRAFSLTNLPHGYHTAVVKHLPNTLDDNSIEVSGSGSAEVASFMLSKQVLHRENDEEFGALILVMEEGLKDLNYQITAINFDLVQAQERLSILKKFVETSLDPKRNNTLSEILELMDFQERELKSANLRDVTLRNKLGKTMDIHGAVQIMLAELRTSGNYKNLFYHATGGKRSYTFTDIAPFIATLPLEERYWPETDSTKELHINFYIPDFEETTFDRTLTFKIEYMTGPAEWRAEYDVHVEVRTPQNNATTDTAAFSAAGTSATVENSCSSEHGADPHLEEYVLRLELYAVVSQSTKEDWNGTMLKLTTAQPNDRIHAPAHPVRQKVIFKAPLNKNVHSQHDMYPTAFPSVVPTALPTSQPSAVPSAVPSCQPSVPSSEPSRLPSGQPSAIPSAFPSLLHSQRHQEVQRKEEEEEERLRQQQQQQQRREEQEARNAADMRAASAATTGSAGGISSAVVFHPPHPVHITSNHKSSHGSSYAGNYHQHQHTWGSQLTHVRPPVDAAPTHSTRLYIQDVVIEPHFFTYVVPIAGTSHLKAWTLVQNTSASSGQLGAPLVESDQARVFIEGNYAGATSVPRTQPGAALKLDLGEDRNVEVQSTYVLPRHSSHLEDKSTWFVVDKVKYKVEVAEWAFTVHSTYSSPHLVVLSEYLPHVGDESIKLELLQPAPASVQKVSGADQQDVWSEEEFISKILAHPSLARPSSAHAQCGSGSGSDKHTTSSPSQKLPPHQQAQQQQRNRTSDGGIDGLHVFVCNGTSNIVWAKWLQPGETLKMGFQYRLVYPDEKSILKVNL